MTDTERSLLAAVCLHPADDTPRLAYADYLDHDADPPQPERAEFVRVQCELARTEGYPGERFCATANGLLRVGVDDCRECRPCELRESRKLISRSCGYSDFVTAFATGS